MSDRPILPYGRQQIDDDDVAAVVEVLRGDWLTQGPAIPAFEAALCAAFGAPHAVVVNSGTAALHLGMMALGIGPGDAVIVPPITFAASGNAALYCGADVVFADVEPDTALISVGAVERVIRGHKGPGRLRAVVAVHYAGLPCDLEALGALCRQHGLELIEDACHAPGATWTDARGTVRSCGDASTSAFAAFSFHPVKHFTTGEGGAVMTARPELADHVRDLRTHGITRAAGKMKKNEGPWWYEMQQLGFNYRMPDLLAALGTSQLAKHARWLERRRTLAARYRARLSGRSAVGVQALRPGREHAYHLFPALVERRREMFDHLVSLGIRPQVHYIPMHLLPYYVERYGTQQLPASEAWYARELSLPMYPGMSDQDVDRVCDALASFRD